MPTSSSRQGDLTWLLVVEVLRRGIVNGKGVESSKLSKMDSEDALKTFNKTKRSITVKKTEPDAPLDIWLPCGHMLPHTYGAYGENASLSMYSHLIVRFMTVIRQVISPIRSPVVQKYGVLPAS